MNAVSDLFGSSGTGVWFDNSAKHLMWKDASRTLPVTADGDLVYVQWSRGIGDNMWDNPDPTITAGGGDAVGAYNTATQTMTVTTVGASSNYPRFQFNLGLTGSANYEVSGRLIGDIHRVGQVRLATSGTSNDVTFNSATGFFATGPVAAGSAYFEIGVDGQFLSSIQIVDLEIRLIPAITRSQATEGSRPIYRQHSDGRSYLDYAGGKLMTCSGSAAGLKFLHSGTGGSAITVLNWGRNQSADRYVESFNATSQIGIRINKATTEPTHQMFIARGVSSSTTTGIIRAMLTGDAEMSTFTYNYTGGTGTMNCYRGVGRNLAYTVSNALVPSTENASAELAVVNTFSGKEYQFIAVSKVVSSSEVGGVYESLKRSFITPVPTLMDYGILLLGQSNMRGAANFADKVAEEPLTGVYCYTKSNEYLLATEPTHYDVNRPSGYNPASVDLDHKCGWALRAVKALTSSHSKTSLLIPAAIGSTSIAQWDTPTTVNDTSTLFGAAMTRFQAARSRFTHPVIMIHGHEASRSLAFAGLDYTNGGVGQNYQNAFKTFLINVLDIIGYGTPIFMVQLAGENDLADAEANAAAGEAMRQMELEFPRLHLVVAHDVKRNASTDAIHVHRDGQDVVADRMSLALRQHLIGEAINGTGPRLLDISKTDRNTIVVEMDKEINASVADYDDMFRVYDEGVEITVSSAARNSDNTRQIIITVEEDIVGPSTVSYGYKAGPNAAARTDFVQDSDGLPLPLFGPISTRNQIPDPSDGIFFGIG